MALRWLNFSGSSSETHECGNADTFDLDSVDLGIDVTAPETLGPFSPELGNDSIPGLGGRLYVPLSSPASRPCSSSPVSRPCSSSPDTQTLTVSKPDWARMQTLSRLELVTVLEDVKALHDLAFQLGQDELKEMVRGRYLNVLGQSSSKV